MIKSTTLIDLLKLEPLPLEGGYYRETYRSPETLDPSLLKADYKTSRNISTAIYFLLTDETFSAIHRLTSDEIFHFYLGDPVTFLLIHQSGESEMIVLGNDISAGHKPQMVVPSGTWQGAFLADDGTCALMGCTVAPGFDFADFEIGKRDELTSRYPDLSEIINKLTRS